MTLESNYESTVTVIKEMTSDVRPTFCISWSSHFLHTAFSSYFNCTADFRVTFAWPVQLITGFSKRRSSVGFMVHKVAEGQDFLLVLPSVSSVIIHPCSVIYSSSHGRLNVDLYREWPSSIPGKCVRDLWCTSVTDTSFSPPTSVLSFRIFKLFSVSIHYLPRDGVSHLTAKDLFLFETEITAYKWALRWLHNITQQYSIIYGVGCVTWS
jgi:hypothetical protein